MKKITLLFFANLRDIAGSKMIEIEIPDGMTILELKKQISQDIPNLRQAMETVVVSVNREFAFDETVIPAKAEVALFPPVSGG